MRHRAPLLSAVMFATLALAAEAAADGPRTAAVFVPLDHDVNRPLLTNVIVPPGGSPAPTLRSVQVGVLQPTESAFAAALANMPSGPFHCESADACHFARMPAYNQGNPNFAFIKVPAATLSAEKAPLGPVVVQGGVRGVVLSNGKLDPFFDSWLPYGPLPPDEGSLGHWFTDICVPTSSSMALMAAILHRSPTTVIRPSTFAARFVAGTKPSTQSGPPATLEHDHTTLAGQMSAVDLQRVVNTAVHESDDPTGGGSVSQFLSLTTGDFAYAGPGPSHQVAWTEHGTAETGGGTDVITGARLADVVRRGFVPIIGLGDYVVHVARQGSGYAMTFERDAGHAIAVNGYSTAPDGKILVHLYNPVYAQAEDKELTVVRGGDARGQCGGGAQAPCAVTLPGGASRGTLVAKGSDVSIAGLGALHDGQHVWFLQAYDALRLE